MISLASVVLKECFTLQPLIDQIRLKVESVVADITQKVKIHISTLESMMSEVNNGEEDAWEELQNDI